MLNAQLISATAHLLAQHARRVRTGTTPHAQFSCWAPSAWLCIRAAPCPQSVCLTHARRPTRTTVAGPGSNKSATTLQDINEDEAVDGFHATTKPVPVAGSLPAAQHIRMVREGRACCTCLSFTSNNPHAVAWIGKSRSNSMFPCCSAETAADRLGAMEPDAPPFACTCHLCRAQACP